jgi:diguanylate cyclase (GGDEF)-like protein
MTLSKQLGISMLVILLIVFSGSLWINVNNTRNFIDTQLASHAQDTATSLGLSISPYVGDDADLPIVSTMMNAIFDRGYYHSIILEDLKGQVLLEKRSQRGEKNAPEWFTVLFPLSPPSSQTEINNGWNIAGKMTIVSDPGLGYQQLWSNAKQSLWLISVVFVLTLSLVWLLVKAITTPIIAVVAQAKAISQRQFDTVKRIPRTPELRVFVEAINSMSLQLSKVFLQITNQAERYRNFAYTDGLTGNGNRRAFEMAFDGLLADSENQPNGYIILLRLSSLAQVNKEFGFESGDAYIKSVCAIMQQHSEALASQMQIYRLNGADFSLLMEEVDKAQTHRFIQNMMADIVNIEKSEYRQGTAHAGVAAFCFNDTLSKVMENADSALAMTNVGEAKYHFADTSGVSQSNSQWREQLQALLALGKVEFVAQEIITLLGIVEYREWFARFQQPENESFYPMAQLIPASIRLDYSQRLDQLVILQALDKMQGSKHNVGLNISRLSLNDPAFHQWLLNILPQDGALRARIVLEIPERALVYDVSRLKRLVENLRNRGIKICVEHFGAQLAAVTHLRDIRPDYLKIDGRFTRNIQNEQDNQLFVQSLINIAHGLNIKVIAEMVETQQEADCLKELAIDFIQGYLLGQPAEIKA